MSRKDSNSYIKSILEEHTKSYDENDRFIYELESLIKKYDKIKFTKQEKIRINKIVNSFNTKINKKRSNMVYLSGVLAIICIIKLII